jgi:hypothetical protein
MLIITTILGINFFHFLGDYHFFLKLQILEGFYSKKCKLDQQSSMHAQCYIIDGFPITTAHFKRANKSNNFKGEAGYGFCANKSQTDYGFKGHLLIDDKGNMASFTLTQTSRSEREAVWELVKNKKWRFLLGDKEYLSARLKEDLANEQASILDTPVRHNMVDPLNKIRRLLETLVEVLVEIFIGQLNRKILAHGLDMLVNALPKNKSLQLEHAICV